jgi:hypothetical protein
VPSVVDWMIRAVFVLDNVLRVCKGVGSVGVQEVVWRAPISWFALAQTLLFYCVQLLASIARLRCVCRAFLVPATALSSHVLGLLLGGFGQFGTFSTSITVRVVYCVGIAVVGALPVVEEGIELFS